MTQKKLWSLVGLVAAVCLVVAMVISFDRQQRRVLGQIEQVPGEKSTSLTSSEGSGRAIYDLALTGTDIQPDSVAFDGESQVVLLDRAARLIITVKPQSQSFVRLPSVPGETPVTAVTLAGGNVYAWAGQLWRYGEREQAWQEVTPALALPEVAQVVKFGDNFYLFGPGQIQKITLDKHGQFLTVDSWLDDDQTLSASSDVYIDGYVYLAEQHLGLKRWLRGRRESLYLEPEVTGTLYLDGDDDYLYVLAPESQQFLLVDPQLDVVLAHADPQYAGCRFVWTRPDEASFFTLCGGQVYQFALPTVDNSPEENQAETDEFEPV